MEGSTHHVGGEVRQLGHAPRRGQGGRPYVIVEVEVSILQPHRVVEAQRYVGQPPPKRGHEVEAVREQLTHCLERVTLGGSRGVEHTGLADVHLCARRLDLKERGIESR